MADVIRLSDGDKKLFQQFVDLLREEDRLHKLACEKYDIPYEELKIDDNNYHDLIVLMYCRARTSVNQSLKDYKKFHLNDEK